MAIILEHLQRPSDAELAEVRRIYEANFTLVEKTPFDRLTTWLSEGSLMLLVARESGGAGGIVAIAMLVALRKTPTMYLMYLAVDRDHHNHGVGSAFFPLMLDFLAQRTDADALFWEVYPARPDDPAHIDNRRIRFYTRAGAQVLTEALHYVAPNYFEGGAIPCWLMWSPIRNGRTAPDRQEVIAWVTGLYERCYNDCMDLCAQVVAGIVAGGAANGV